MRSLLWSLLCVVMAGTVNPALVFSAGAAPDDTPPGVADFEEKIPSDLKVLEEFFEREGVTIRGVWKDAELVAYARKMSRASGSYTLVEGLEQCDALYEETAGKEGLQRLEDDLLLLKARMLLGGERYREAQEVYQTVITKYPQGTMEWTDDWAIEAALMPHISPDRQLQFIRATYYRLRHPNRSSEAARLGLAQCAIGLKDYEEAEGILAGLMPAGEERPPSEDPLVRTPPPEGYLAFWDDLRFGKLLEQRVDKIALLFLARCKVAQGKENEARDLYGKMLTLFPASAMWASYELELLKAGESDLIKEKLRMHRLQPSCSVMPGDKVREILKLPEQAERIEAAKAYYATLHDWLRKSDESYRKADKIRSQEATPVE